MILSLLLLGTRRADLASAPALQLKPASGAPRMLSQTLVRESLEVPELTTFASQQSNIEQLNTLTCKFSAVQVINQTLFGYSTKRGENLSGQNQSARPD